MDTTRQFHFEQPSQGPAVYVPSLSTRRFAADEFSANHFYFDRKLEGPALYVPEPLVRRLVVGAVWTLATLACAFALLVAWGQA